MGPDEPVPAHAPASSIAAFQAQFSGIAAQEPEVVAAWAKKLGFKAESFRQSELKLQAHVLVRDDVVLTAIPGSTEAKHLSLDAQVRQVLFDDRAVHSGFATAAGKLWPELKTSLLRAQQQDPARPVDFTGHSLGAAIAGLAAMAWDEAGGQVGSAHLYATPKIGGADFAVAFRARIGDRSFAYVNGADVVAQSPPGSAGYWEHCSNVKLLQDSEQAAGPGGLPELSPPPGVDREQFNQELAKVVAFAASRCSQTQASEPPTSLLSWLGLGGVRKMFDDYRLAHCEEKLNAQALGELAGAF